MQYEMNNLFTKILDETKVSKADFHTTQDIPLSLSQNPYTMLDLPISLPDPKISKMSLEEALDLREAIKEWEDEFVKLADLSTILKLIFDSDTKDWENDFLNDLELGVVVYAQKVDGLNPAIYHYSSKEHELVPIGNLESLNMNEIVLQSEFGNAPVILIFTGKLGATIHHYGSSGLRRLLIRGGMAADRAWLASISLGYVGSLFAGILPKSLYTTVKIDGYQLTSLFAYSFGVPLSELSIK
ncbi:hypothetical protein [Lysinibacillus capsici]|uniref:hypothetical protein n=1 Tax=Lysinibacillus capsici TaxID=2115968 RepID=UPI0028A23225|nr:hypothetical protein [Lysinibacillus capsici]